MEKKGALAMDEMWMREALAQAREALEAGETPVGCVVVREGKIIARARNRREELRDPTAHAEVLAIREAARVVGDWRLTGCCMYVTLEPCPMCAGAIINARIPRIYFGASDPKAGSCGSVIDLFSLPYNHKPEVVRGVMQEECAAVLKNFFRRLREAKASKRGPES